jgi:hypothetical protein
MSLPRRSLAALGAALALAAALPLGTMARGAHTTATHSTPSTHTLPTGPGSTRVFLFGVQGGSLRPWSVKLNLDGSIAATGITTHQKLTDATNALKGLLALSDAEGYFSLKKTVGCLSGVGNPDVSSRFISIHTATGTKRVQDFGSCAATAKYEQLYAVLEAAAGIGS